MGKKKGKKKAVAKAPAQQVSITEDQQRAVAELRGNLELELERIENEKPQLPPPPNRHELVQVIHREAEDPADIWIKVTCRNCAFLVYSKYVDLAEKLNGLSDLCALPFGTRREAQDIVKSWEQAVERAYREMQARKTVVEPTPPNMLLNRAEPQRFTDDFDRAEDGIGTKWIQNPGFGGPLDGNVIARGFSQRVDRDQES